MHRSHILALYNSQVNYLIFESRHYWYLNGLFLALCTALLGIVARDGLIEPRTQVLLGGLVGVFVSGYWRSAIEISANYVHLRIGQVRRIEEHLGLTDDATLGFPPGPFLEGGRLVDSKSKASIAAVGFNFSKGTNTKGKAVLVSDLFCLVFILVSVSQAILAVLRPGFVS